MKKRLFAFLCILVMLVSVMSFASADKKRILVQTAPASNAGTWNSYRRVNNGETVTFNVTASVYRLYEKVGSNKYDSFNDVIYNCEGKVTGESNVSWINIYETDYGFDMSIYTNDTLKTRTGTVKVSGSGYSATLKFVQMGTDRITSAKRTGNKITLKFQLSDAKLHYLYVSGYKSSKKAYSGESIFDGTTKKKSITFTVKKGWTYSFGIGPALKQKNEYGTYYEYDTTNWGNIEIKKVTGSEKLKKKKNIWGYNIY